MLPPESDGEDRWLRQNPRVAGYATGNDPESPASGIVMNPYAPLPERAKVHVAANEAVRNHLFDNGRVYNFPIAPHQHAWFQENAPGYAQQPQMARHTIVARILSDDPSAGPYTPEQKAAADGVLWGLLLKD